jgi:L-fuconolactonase
MAEPLMLPSRICDPHHHLWSMPSSHYLIDDLRTDLGTVASPISTVFVECGTHYRESGPQHLVQVGETEWVAANAGDVIRGIVGATDLRLGTCVEDALDAHIAAAQGRFRGIRQRATWDPNPSVRPSTPDPGEGLLLDADFRKGFEVLHSLGLSFDAWVYFMQLPDVAGLARCFPATTIILNHLGGPIMLGPYTDRGEVLDRWRELMIDVASCPNVVLKVGGIGMPIYGMGWHKQAAPPSSEEVAEHWREPVRWCIETFGVDRCMLESNFPVDRFSMNYATLWDAFDLMTNDLSPTERDALFHDTAVRAYRLNEDTT